MMAKAPLRLLIASFFYVLVSFEDAFVLGVGELQFEDYLYFILFSFPIWFLLRGKNWARRVVILLSFFFVCLSLIGLLQDEISTFSFILNFATYLAMLSLLLFCKKTKSYFPVDDRAWRWFRNKLSHISARKNKTELDKKADKNALLLIAVPLCILILQQVFPWKSISSTELDGLLSSDFVKIWTLGITLVLTPIVCFLVHLYFRVGAILIIYFKYYAFFFAVITYMNIGEINIFYADKNQKPAIEMAVLHSATRGNTGKGGDGCVRGACLEIVDPSTLLRMTNINFSFRPLSSQSKRAIYRGLKTGQQVKLFTKTGFFGARWVTRVEFSFADYIKNLGGEDNLRSSDFEVIVDHLDPEELNQFRDQWQRSCLKESPENCRIAAYLSRIENEHSKTKAFLLHGCKSEDFMACYNYFFYDGFSQEDRSYAMDQIHKMCQKDQLYPEKYVPGICQDIEKKRVLPRS